MPSSVTVRDGVAEVVIEGRLDAVAMGVLASALRERVSTGRAFGVVLDRRLLTAPTAAGREALARWGAEDLPAVAGLCAGWADVFDERRAASLARAAAAREEARADRDAADDAESTDHHGPRYPHQVLTDVAAARAWVARMLAGHAPPSPAQP